MSLLIAGVTCIPKVNGEGMKPGHGKRLAIMYPKLGR